MDKFGKSELLLLKEVIGDSRKEEICDVFIKYAPLSEKESTMFFNIIDNLPDTYFSELDLPIIKKCLKEIRTGKYKDYDSYGSFKQFITDYPNAAYDISFGFPIDKVNPDIKDNKELLIASTNIKQQMVGRYLNILDYDDKIFTKMGYKIVCFPFLNPVLDKNIIIVLKLK